MASRVVRYSGVAMRSRNPGVRHASSTILAPISPEYAWAISICWSSDSGSIGNTWSGYRNIKHLLPGRNHDAQIPVLAFKRFNLHSKVLSGIVIEFIPSIQKKQCAATICKLPNLRFGYMLKGSSVMKALDQIARSNRPVTQPEIERNDRISGDEMVCQLQYRCRLSRTRWRNNRNSLGNFESGWQPTDYKRSRVVSLQYPKSKFDRISWRFDCFLEARKILFRGLLNPGEKGPEICVTQACFVERDCGTYTFGLVRNL